jgi:fructose-1,6-bisphosphatase
MYDNLQKINLTNYLNRCCGGEKWISEGWLESLDKFVGILSDQNISVLKSKINDNLGLYQINDIVNEIMIACAYHPEANFVSEGTSSTYDLFDQNSDLKIEVKSLNEGADEQERHKKDTYCGVAALPMEKEAAKEKKDMEDAIRKKCREHLQKAVGQIAKKGKIYLVYDWNLLTSQNIGTKEDPRYTNTRRSPLSGEEVKNIIDKCTDEVVRVYTDVQVGVIFFGDLRHVVANSGV